MKNLFLNKKIISLLITLFVLLFLISLGPVEALLLKLTVADNDIVQGEKINFEIEIKIEHSEFLDIKNISLELTGPQKLLCEFLPNGSLLNDCPEISILQTQTAKYLHKTTSYGYGYGYGYSYGYTGGSLKYNLTLQSENLLPGEYSLSYVITKNRLPVESPKRTITIRPPESVQSCSIRAMDGIASIKGENFTTRNRLNLFVPSKKASDGRGSFTVQNSKRISYNYYIRGAQQIGPDIIKFYTVGEIRERTYSYPESAVITLNKNSLIVSVDGNHLNVKDMRVSFINC